LKKVAIIGGGLAGLISGIELSKKGVPCLLFEKRNYPLHRVCGEYISNEALPYLKRTDLFPEKFNPPVINRFQISSTRGQTATMPLDLGGFGISRFAFDHFLYEKAKSYGVEFQLDTEIASVDFLNDHFEIDTGTRKFEADLVIGAFGKRSRMDVHLQRDFITKRSPYIGVKYHVRTDHPSDLVGLHNFEGGYCGIAAVEGGMTNLCYLARRKSLQQCGSISELEERILYKNPVLHQIFTASDFLGQKPVVINEISFETKSPVDAHMLMAGDAAGMITPLCGNGMAIAIHSATIAARLIEAFCTGKISRNDLEAQYSRAWSKTFSTRLRTGRVVQKLFGSASLSNLAVRMIMHSKPFARAIMRRTHGEEF
jgi:flavin-dependent dehydrogenase